MGVAAAQPRGHRSVPASPAVLRSRVIPAGKRNSRGNRGNCGSLLPSLFLSFFPVFKINFDFIIFFYIWEKPFSSVAFPPRQLSRFSQPCPGRCSLHSSTPFLFNSRVTRIFFFFLNSFIYCEWPEPTNILRCRGRRNRVLPRASLSVTTSISVRPV